MKTNTLILISALFFTASAACYAQTREQALKPHIDKIWDHWASLPVEYREKHHTTLENYLTLFTTNNGHTWNRNWAGFTKAMGPEFQPLHTNVIEAMKVAEAYESCFPNPEQKMENIANTIFDYTPTNAVLFIHDDVFETILLIQQQEGLRPDILIINSSRLVDASYMKIVQDRYPEELTFDVPKITKNVFAAARKQKEAGDPAFKDLNIAGEGVTATGPQVVNSLMFLMMKEISQTIPNKSALFMPSFITPDPVPKWRNLNNAGLFFTWQEIDSASSSFTSEWTALIDAAAPPGSPVHGEMANSIEQSLHAATDLLNAQNKKGISNNMIGTWVKRTKSVSIISGKEIRINKEKKMAVKTNLVKSNE